jgi:hypothetical protein
MEVMEEIRIRQILVKLAFIKFYENSLNDFRVVTSKFAGKETDVKV